MPPRPPRAFLPLAASLTAVLLAVGLLHVQAQVAMLDLAERTSRALEVRSRLTERLRLLEAERAYLRSPRRLKDVAIGRLGLVPAPPQRVFDVVVQEARR